MYIVKKSTICLVVHDKHTLFQEKSYAPDAVKVINTNIKKGRLEDRAYVERKDALDFIKTTSKKFDVIFLDPPYASGLYEEVLRVIRERGILSPEGVVTCECDAGYNFSFEGFNTIKDKTYGKVRLVVLEEAKQA